MAKAVKLDSIFKKAMKLYFYQKTFFKIKFLIYAIDFLYKNIQVPIIFE